MIILHTKNQKEAFTGALNEEYEEESFIYNDLSMFDLTNYSQYLQPVIAQ